MSYLLDTSALLAYYLEEPGAGEVEEILLNPRMTTAMSVLSVFELRVRLTALGVDVIEVENAVAQFALIVNEVVPVTIEIVNVAEKVRREASSRIAAVDCLIAATAASREAVLVNRDRHFRALRQDFPRQLVLPDKLG
jgi:predicted nucleic acid-binding protein